MKNMKRPGLAIGLLLAICLWFYVIMPAFHRARLSEESGRAVTALSDCYRFVFASTMDGGAQDQPRSMPGSLDDVPDWNRYVNEADPTVQALYRRIDWHPPQTPTAGAEIASIEFPNCRAVVSQEGSAFSVMRK